MKTTFDLPDALVRKAKALAARQGRPLRNLVEEALDEKLGRSEGGARAIPGVREGRRETWEEWRAKLAPGAGGTLVRADAAADDAFFEALDSLRQRGTRRRNPFAGRK